MNPSRIVGWYCTIFNASHVTCRKRACIQKCGNLTAPIRNKSAKTLRCYHCSELLIELQVAA